MSSVVSRFGLRVAPLLAALGLSVIPVATNVSQAATCPITGCIPVTTISAPAQQLLSNGGFEEPFNYPNWSLHSAQYDSGNGHAHCGPTSLALHQNIFWSDYGYRASDTSAMQSVTIPANANGADLDLWVFFPSTTTLTQTLDIQVAKSGTYTFTDVGTFTNSSVGKGSWKHLGPINLSAFRGQTIDLLLQGGTATPLWTLLLDSGSFYVDDVALWTGTHLLSSSC